MNISMLFYFKEVFSGKNNLSKGELVVVSLVLVDLENNFVSL